MNIIWLSLSVLTADYHHGSVQSFQIYFTSQKKLGTTFLTQLQVKVFLPDVYVCIVSYMCVCIRCVCVGVGVCVLACGCVCVYACMHVYMHTLTLLANNH